MFALAMSLAVVAAIRSTWSPCGVSILSTITPMTESARGHRFRSTAWWYVFGSLIGGLTLGAVIALLAILIERWSPTESTRLMILAAIAPVAVASDGRLGGFQLPGHDRQVNEQWLDRYRSWVYGAGFGWQIGFGLTTYIMTAAVYLLVVAGALGGSVVGALLLGSVFGLIRGIAVFASADIKDHSAMVGFHRRFEVWRQPVRKGMIVVLGGVGMSAALLGGGLIGLLFASATSIATALAVRTRGETAYRVGLADLG